MNRVLSKIAALLVLFLALSTAGCDSDDNGSGLDRKKLIGIWACEYHWSPVVLNADGSGEVYYTGEGEEITWTYDAKKSQIAMPFVGDEDDVLIIDIIEFTDLSFKGYMYWKGDTRTDKIYTFERKEDLSFLE